MDDAVSVKTVPSGRMTCTGPTPLAIANPEKTVSRRLATALVSVTLLILDPSLPSHVLVFATPGCPACEELSTTFRAGDESMGQLRDDLIDGRVVVEVEEESGELITRSHSGKTRDSHRAPFARYGVARPGISSSQRRRTK